MNAGYLFLILCWILCMLTLTHWLDFLWKGKEYSLRRQRQKLLFTILFIIILQNHYIPISTKMALNAGVACVAGVLFFYYYWKDQSGYRLQVLAVVLFLAVFYAVSYELFLLDPILMFISPLIMLPAFMTLFVVLTTTNLHHQWLMMAGGLLIGEVLHKIFLLKHVPFIYIGDALFRDQFIVALILVTMAHYSIQISYKSFQNVIRSFRSLRQSDGKQEG